MWVYHYFPKGKEQMAATVLDFVTAELQENLLKPLKGKGDPILRVKAMGETLDRFFQRVITDLPKTLGLNPLPKGQDPMG